MRAPEQGSAGHHPPAAGNAPLSHRRPSSGPHRSRSRTVLFGLLCLFGCDDRVPTGPILVSGRFDIRSQSDLNALDAVEVIDGNLTIAGQGMDPEDPVRDLRPLRNLTRVTGNLYIDDVDSVRSLQPFSKLRHVGSNFFIGHNSNVSSLAPLRNLYGVGLALFVQDNDRLQSLDGLQGIRRFPREVLQIALNDSLESLRGLDNLTTDGEAVPSGQIEIIENPRLRTLDGLNQLRRIGDLRIAGNDALYDIAALRTLRSAREVIIGACPILQDLSALAGLDSCTSLVLFHLPSVLTPLASVRMGNLTLIDLPIADFSVFSPMTELHFLEIRELPLVTDLIGFENLRRLDRLFILDNPLLESLQGLDGPESLKYVRITGNRSLCAAAIDSWLAKVSVESEPVIADNGGGCRPGDRAP